MAKAKMKSKKAPKAAQTAAFVDEYKGKATFGIWSVDEDGDKVGDYPLIAFGIKKAEALMEHMAALEEYVESGGELPTPKKKPKTVIRPADSDEDDDETEDEDEDEAPVVKKKKPKAKEVAKPKKKPKVRRRAASDDDE